MPAADWPSLLQRALRDERRVRSAVILDGPAELAGARCLWIDGDDDTEPRTFLPSGEPGELPADLVRAAADAAEGMEGTAELDTGSGTVTAFVEAFEPPPKLVVVGAVHIADHLVHFAQRLGFHCVVVDARAAFATEERFGHAHRLIVGWPGEVLPELPLRATTYCAFLTHDPKLDDPGLLEALRVGARYVGALGSTRTHHQRLERLREAGCTEEQLARIDAPIGLDLGGRRPEEIALAIAARLVMARAGKDSESGSPS